jgi:hypothetical protein
MQSSSVESLMSITQEPDLDMRVQIVTGRQLAEPFTGMPLSQSITRPKPESSQALLQRNPGFCYSLLARHWVITHREDSYVTSVGGSFKPVNHWMEVLTSGRSTQEGAIKS